MPNNAAQTGIDASINIINIMVHSVEKEQHGVATIHTTDDISPVTDSARRLVTALNEKYSGRAGKSYGKFEADDVAINYPIIELSRNYFINQTISFQNYSQVLMTNLQARMESEALSTGGYVFFVQYEKDNKEYLMVAIINEVIGTAISNYNIIDATHLDIRNLKVAGRINVSDWQNNQAERYISFLKGTTNISGYFKLFLGCNDILLASQETDKLITALKTFSENQTLTTQQKDTLYQSAFDYLDQMGKDGQQVSLDALANHLWPTEPQLLADELSNEDLQLSDDFTPDRRKLKKLVKFSAKSNNWELKFSRESLRNNSVRFDPAGNTITLTDIPDELRQELLSEQEDNE